MAGPFDIARYKRPHSEATIHDLPRDRASERDTAEMPTENLNDLLGRVSENSTTQIDNLVGDFGRLREKLRIDGERIQRDVEEYRALSEKVMQLTKTISESVEKVRASVDQ
jgi:methyl-accepting chemotaxis protein